MTDPERFFNDAYFAQFQTKKYRNPNPLQRRQIRKLLGRVVEIARGFRPTTILDAGAGEGFLTGYLVDAFPQARITAVDFSREDLTRLRQHFPVVETIESDLENLSLQRRFDLGVATEVLEHLRRPEAALARFVAHADRVIVTVPHEPLFRLTNFLRGKNLTRLGNDPEHVNHWSPRSFRRWLEQTLVVETVESIFPWIVAAGHRRT